MEDAFVIIDLKNKMLHLVRTSPPLVMSLDKSDLENAAQVLDADKLNPQDIAEPEWLLRAAYLLSSGDPDSTDGADNLLTLSELLREVESEDTCIALRYQGPSTGYLIYRKR